MLIRGFGLSIWSTGRQSGATFLYFRRPNADWHGHGSRVRFYYLLSKFYPMKILT